MAAKGDIEIKEQYCVGCGYCVYFCNRECIVIPGDRFTPQGYLLPVFVNTDKCTGCAACARMCPHMAIDVYKYVEEKN